MQEHLRNVDCRSPHSGVQMRVLKQGGMETELGVKREKHAYILTDSLCVYLRVFLLNRLLFS